MALTFTDYQTLMKRFMAYDGCGTGSKEAYAYVALGLAGEAGEVANQVKRMYRTDGINRTKIRDELGDVLWYWTACCIEMGFDPGEVMQDNIDKLNKRWTDVVRSAWGSTLVDVKV